MMLLSEKDAQTKWCAHTRVIRWETLNQGEVSIDHLIGGTNRDALGKTKNPGSCRCIASECMAWRWATPPKHACDEQPDFEYRERGYCGLAGRPE